MNLKHIFSNIFLSKNSINLKTYDAGIDDYVKKSNKNIEGNKKIWIDTALWLIQKTDLIFEIGSGPWLDADYMETQWYRVVRSDASKWFIEYQKNLWKNIIFYDVSLPTPLSQKFSLVYCNLVLQHFPKSNLQKLLQNISQILSPEWYLALGIKLWEWEKWEYDKLNLPRYFSYYSEIEFEDELKKVWYKKVFSVIENKIYSHTIFQKF